MARKKKKKKAEKSDEITKEDLGLPVKKEESGEMKAIESSAETQKGKKKTTKKTSQKKTQKKETPTKTKQTSKTKQSSRSRSRKKKESEFKQSETNVGMVGHVDHGKTTLVEALSGVWTERYADEVNRGITIKLGYAETEMMECPQCKKIYTYNLANLLRKSKKDPKGYCPECRVPLKFRRRISFVDAPGHEILMATMLSGASLMDGAVLLIAANEKCPQPQTREHLAALEIAKIENIIIVQNKVDAVSKERAYENYKEIKEFIKGTIAENAPIIPVSAVFKANIDIVAQKIEECIPTPEFDEDADFLFQVARSFDVNKPGTPIKDLKGGVIGGSIFSGRISIGDEIEIRPGYKINNKYQPLLTKVVSIYEGSHSLESAKPGGLIALGTQLDPAITRTDQLIGNVVGTPGTLPDVLSECKIEVHLLDKVLGAEEVIEVHPLKLNEMLMIVVGTMTSAGTIKTIGKMGKKDKNIQIITLQLVRPICALQGSIIAISRKINNRFRLIGYGYLM